MRNVFPHLSTSFSHVVNKKLSDISAGAQEAPGFKSAMSLHG